MSLADPIGEQPKRTALFALAPIRASMGESIADGETLKGEGIGLKALTG